MKRTEIKQVNDQLTIYHVPRATIKYSGPATKIKVKSSKTAFEVLYANWEQSTMEVHESFYYLLLNRANRVNGIIQHSTGGLAGTVTDQRMILASCLITLSSSIILAHNHPSGNTKPSEADIKVTKQIRKSAEMMNIQVLDHIILTKDSYFSMADDGII